MTLYTGSNRPWMALYGPADGRLKWTVWGEAVTNLGLIRQKARCKVVLWGPITKTAIFFLIYQCSYGFWQRGIPYTHGHWVYQWSYPEWERRTVSRVMAKRAAMRICVITGWNLEGQAESPKLKRAICGTNMLGIWVTSWMRVEMLLQNETMEGHSHQMWRIWPSISQCLQHFRN